MKEGKNPVGLLATKGGTISFKVHRKVDQQFRSKSESDINGYVVLHMDSHNIVTCSDALVNVNHKTLL